MKGLSEQWFFWCLLIQRVRAGTWQTTPPTAVWTTVRELLAGLVLQSGTMVVVFFFKNGKT